MGEEFLEYEVKELSKYFDVHIVSKSRATNKIRNTDFVTVVPSKQSLLTLLQSLRALIRLVGMFVADIKEGINGSTELKIGIVRMQQSARRYVMAALLVVKVKTALNVWKKNKTTKILYSYWGGPWALALAACEEDFFCRLGGHDIYGEQNRGGRVPGQEQILRYARMTLAPSESSWHYLQKQYFKTNYQLICLPRGVPEQTRLNPETLPGTFRICTISSLTANKRLHVVVKAMKRLRDAHGINVDWLHIGGGPQRECLWRQALDADLADHVVFTGHIGSGERGVFRILRTTPVSLVLNVSRSEGLPSALQEALSFGIPIVATMVGGNEDLVRLSGGVRIRSEATAWELADTIAPILMETSRERRERRLRALDAQRTHFNLSTNTKKRAEFLNS